MKITKIEPLLAIHPSCIPGHAEKGTQPTMPASVYQYLYVRVHTDEGIVGLGEAGMSPKAQTVLAYLDGLNHHLVGRNPLDIEALWQYMYRQPYERGGPIIMSAIAGIDLALWDIAGKALGVPVYRLLGGPVRDKIRLFASLNFSDWLTNTKGSAEDREEGLQRGREFVNQGFTAIRTGLPSYLVDVPIARLVHDIAELFGDMREAFGPDVDLALDVHRRLRVFEAIQLAKALEPFNLLFIEDPIMAENHDAMAEVARSTHIPIATGENLYTPYQFRELFAKRAAHFARIDLCLAGGITAGKKIAHMAEAAFLNIIPHQPWSPVATAAYAHFCATVHNLTVLEYLDTEVTSVFVDRLVPIDNGYMLLPEGPGLGIELNEDVVSASMKAIRSDPHFAAELFVNPTLQRRDGTLTDW